MGAPLLTQTRCSSEDVLTDYVLTEDENQEEIENDVLVEDGETVSQDVFSSNDNWTLYMNNIPFLKVRRERHGNQMQASITCAVPALMQNNVSTIHYIVQS